MKDNPTLTLMPVSSLEKIFPDERPACNPFIVSSMLLNERFSFQIAYHWDGPRMADVTINADGPLAKWAKLSSVGLVPSEYPCHPDTEGFLLRRAPGLFPDPLYPIPDPDVSDPTHPSFGTSYGDSLSFSLVSGQWRSVWVSIPADCSLPAGTYEIPITFAGSDGRVLAETSFRLTRISARLPKQSLIHTEWLHTDCIANWYETEVFSPRYWQLVESYLSAAATYGINMILTPIFTPPLDTAVHGERKTVQLVRVTVTDSGYSFDFEHLDHWISLCDKTGIQYLEFSHLFTQWGACHAPKIMAEKDGKLTQIFGWDTDAASPEYCCFLQAFLKVLISHIKERHLEQRCYFHISDEPSREHLASYQKARSLVVSCLEGLPIMDALSDYEFYKSGLVTMPICANNHIRPFLDHGVPGLWTYYCTAQHQRVSNRFFSMPSSRTRIIGAQMYYYGIAGFLHWGFNFWNTQLSRYAINPYCVTDAGAAFPSGDPFLVYPGTDAPIPSIRAEVFLEGLQDMRLFTLLEQKIGKDAVKDMMEQYLGPISFDRCSDTPDGLLALRAACHEKLEGMTPY